MSVQSRETRDSWAARIREAVAGGKLPTGVKEEVYGKQTVDALKRFDWSNPDDLAGDDLLRRVTSTLLAIEEVLRPT